jgi:hypothetical protein
MDERAVPHFQARFLQLTCEEAASSMRRRIILPTHTADRLGMELAMEYLATHKLHMSAMCAKSESDSQIAVRNQEKWPQRTLLLTPGAKPIQKLCRVSLGLSPDPGYVVISSTPVKMTAQLTIDPRRPDIEFSSSDDEGVEEDRPELDTEAKQEGGLKEEEEEDTADDEVERRLEEAFRRNLVDRRTRVEEEEEEEHAADT